MAKPFNPTSRPGGVRRLLDWRAARRGLAISWVALALCACEGREPGPASNASAFKRLDGSTILSADIDATVERLMRAARVPGAGIALLNDARVVYLKTYGVRSAAWNLPLRPDSVMSAASFSKLAFAYLVMQLVQEGALALDTPVVQYLPKPLPDYEGYADLAGDARYKKITARMLLDHTSGFPNLRVLTDEKRLGINFEPGTRYAYSGEGIGLLQLVVENVTHRPLEDLMRERVFGPLGMVRTSMVWRWRFEWNHANGYDEVSSALGPQRRFKASAIGSMQTTPADFALFMQALMQGRRLNRETKALMLEPQVTIRSKHQFPTLADESTDENQGIRLSYGLGAGLYWTPYGKAYFKEGHDDGWRNYTVCFDEAKTGIVIMTNSSNGEGIYKELLETLLRNPYTPLAWEGFTPYDERR